MKYIIILILIFSCFYSCKKEDEYCKRYVLKGYSTNKIADLFPNSVHFMDTVILVKSFVTEELYQMNCKKCCPPPKCLETNEVHIFNISPQSLDIVVELSGKGEYSYFIPKGDSLSVIPIPDYCTYNTWGKIKDIQYK